MLSVEEIQSLVVHDSDGTRIVNIGANISIYIDMPLEEFAENFFRVYEAFLDICPTDKLKWFLTNSMEKHEEITSRTLLIPKTWIKSTRKDKSLMRFEIKDTISKYYSDAPDWKFNFYSYSRDGEYFPDNTTFIEFLFPLGFLGENMKTFYDFSVYVFRELPFLSGHAGYTLEVSNYYRNRGAYDTALSLGMRYKELDIAEPYFHEYMKDEGDILGIKGVNWLTFINSNFVKKLNIDKNQKSKNIKYTDVGEGLLLQAGEKPLVADINKGEFVTSFKEVYEIVKPIILKEPCPLDIKGGFERRVDNTQKWIHRFKNHD